MKNLLLSAFMVSGASIGSGVLALPMLAAGPGLVYTAIFIIFTFFLSYLIAIKSIEVYARYDDHDVNAATLAADFFGKKGYMIAIFFNVLSIGACAAAYINAGGDLLSKTVLPLFNINLAPRLSMLIFFILFMPAFVIGLNFISRLNSLIFVTKFAVLAGAILLGLSLVSAKIFVFVPDGLRYLGSGASTMFCIWAMHMTLPLVLKINGWDKEKARLAVFIGLLVPALAYIGWLLLIFSLVTREEFLHLTTIGDLIHYALTKPIVSVYISALVGIFSNITVLTAFLSIGFSLVAFVVDAFSWVNTKKYRFYATMLSFSVPVVIAIVFSKAFVIIYQQSNIFIIGSALIPIAASYAYNKKNAIKSKFQIEGVLFVLGSLIIISQILNDLSIFPSYVHV